jgi:membrane-bound serine protease (ClpP class)
MDETIYVLLLILAGLAMFLLEILTPTFGVLAILGVGAMGGAVWLAFTISGGFGLTVLAAIVIGTPLYLVLVVRYLPRMPLTRKLFLERAASGTGAGTPKAQKYAALVGKTGTTETQLRPAGAVRVDGQRIPAVAESGVIEPGETVTVIRTVGMNVVVRRADSSKQNT